VRGMHALVLVLGRVFWAVQAQPREVGGDVGCRAAQWQKLSPDRELYQQHYFEPERGTTGEHDVAVRQITRQRGLYNNPRVTDIIVTDSTYWLVWQSIVKLDEKKSEQPLLAHQPG
jgi:hypothetical protein